MEDALAAMRPQRIKCDMNPKLAIAIVFSLILIFLFAVFYIKSDIPEDSRPSLEELDTVPLDVLYNLYRQDIDNNKPHDYTLSTPLAKRGPSAAYFMLNRLIQRKNPLELRGIVIALEEMKYRNTFDPCGQDRFYATLVRTWQTIDPKDQYNNSPSVKALCLKL
jgi:hypothetical protein